MHIIGKTVLFLLSFLIILLLIPVGIVIGIGFGASKLLRPQDEAFEYIMWPVRIYWFVRKRLE